MAVESNRNSYGNILKSIGLFGGVRVFQILIGIVRNKLIAVLIGPTGMGIAGILTSTTNMINAATGLGLHTSSVRDIAKSYQSNNEERIGKVTTVLRKLVVFTGILGALITFFLSPYLSQWSFGNDDFVNAFRLVSVILLFDQLATGQTALMQGTFHYKYMARSALYGSLFGLIISIPLYYYWRLDAIVPVIVLSSLINLLLTTYYSQKVPLKSVNLSYKDVLSEGKGMIVLGAAIALAGFIGTGKEYILRSFISTWGSVSDVGLYTAGMAIATQYMDVILRSMGSDYSPRLAAIADDKPVFIETINKQIKLLLTIVSPLILLFIVFIREITILLYSSEFVAITGMIEWIMLGMFFRSFSWCLSYSIIARGDSKKYLINELFGNLYTLVLYAGGYIIGSFTGMGIGFLLGYLIYTIQTFLICKKSFNYVISKDVFKLSGLLLVPLVISFITLTIICGSAASRYYIGMLLIIVMFVLSYKLLDKMIPVRQMSSNMFRKYVKNN